MNIQKLADSSCTYISDLSKICTPLISYYELEENFYLSMRNELTDSKLKKIKACSGHLEKPRSFGKYIDLSHYLETLNIVLQSTQETRHCGYFFFKKILPTLKHRENFLDVGPGNGKLTRWISKKFENTTVIDSNEEVIKKLKAPSDKNSFKKIHSSIRNIDLQSNDFDFCLMSHVLYYLDNKFWLEAVEKIYNATKANGKILIVLSGDALGKASLIKNFGGKLPQIDKFINLCANKFKSNIRVTLSKEKFISCDLNVMLHIAGLFLRDGGVIATEEELTKYILKYHKADDKYFEITSLQKFILIEK